jgi:hypothetical protein
MQRYKLLKQCKSCLRDTAQVALLEDSAC